MTRVAVFIDWQNIYLTARKAFGLSQRPARFGSVSPIRVADLITGLNQRSKSCQLQRVAVYRGLPSPRRDPRGNAACLAQVEAWRREGLGLVDPSLRPLTYRTAGGSQMNAFEKGVDVQLAVDVVSELMLDRCDLAVVFSHDSDFMPLIEAICRLKGASRVETASWASGRNQTRIPPVRGVFNHFLGEDVFRKVEDRTDYAKS